MSEERMVEESLLGAVLSLVILIPILFLMSRMITVGAVSQALYKIVRNKTAPASSANIEVIDETDVSSYKLKTISIKADKEITVKIYCYDDPSDFNLNDPYYTDTVPANTMKTYSFEDLFKYVRVYVDNANTSDATIKVCSLKAM